MLRSFINKADDSINLFRCLVIILCMISSFFIKTEVTTEKLELIKNDREFPFQSGNSIFANSIMESEKNFSENNNLNFKDGFKNGIVSINSYYKRVIVRSGVDSLIKTSYHLEDAHYIRFIIAFILGFLLYMIKNVFICILPTFTFSLGILFQASSLSYKMGFILSIFALFSIIVVDDISNNVLTKSAISLVFSLSILVLLLF